MTRMTRRGALGGMAAGGAVLAMPRIARSQQPEIKVALVAPLSGPWGRSGQLMKIGCDLGIEDINAQGGVRLPGGAKIRLVTADAGDSVERAKNAAQRLVAQEPDVVAGTGAWLSSFTLAVTEVTERAHLPWLTLSYADPITARGFHYIIQTNTVSSEQAKKAMPAVLDLAQAATGARPKTVAIIADGTATPKAFLDPLRQGGFDRLGLTLITDQVYTPPLSDATSMVQAIRSARPRPDFILFYSSNLPDATIILQKLHEFGLPQTRIPLVAPGAVHLGAPEVLKNVTADLLEGTIMIVANWTSKRQDDLLPGLTRRSGEPWLTSDAISSYGDMWLIKDAIERAGSVDREKVMAALRATNTTTGPARYYLGDRLQFDENGRRIGGAVVMVQWRDGKPLTVSPAADAFVAPRWPHQ